VLGILGDGSLLPRTQEWVLFKLHLLEVVLDGPGDKVVFPEAEGIWDGIDLLISN